MSLIQTANLLAEPHFAIGLTVEVKPGARPVGWQDGDDQDFGDPTPDGPRQITDVCSQESVALFGSFEVGGNWYDPSDIEVVG